MLETSVDEISFVLLNNFEGELHDYRILSTELVESLIYRLNLDDLFTRDSHVKGFAGYDILQTFDNWKIIIAFNQFQPQMGILVKFGGLGLKNFLNKQGKDYEVYHLANEIYSFCTAAYLKYRVSKIDFCADFINDSIDISDIGKNLNSHLIIRSGNGRRNQSKIKYLAEDNQISTVYIGNHRKKGASRVFMRIYDKKREQISKRGAFYSKALEVDNWTRFEVSFSNPYSHQIGEDLLRVTSRGELASLICRRITDRYQFIKIENGKEVLMPYSSKLLDNANKELDTMSINNVQDSTLTASYNYLTTNSGLMAFIYKISQIYGNQSVELFFRAVQDELTKYNPNAEVRNFIKKYKTELSQSNLPWVV